MSGTITKEQQDYINGLRAGDSDESKIVFKPTLSKESINDFGNFKSFLIERGHPNPQPADLYLTIAREDFLSLLYYAENRHCLILQCCFGLNRPPVLDTQHKLVEVGRVVLLNKGNFYQVHGQDDIDFFEKDTVFRTPGGKQELFRNVNITQPIPTLEADHYLNNFRSLYKSNAFTFIQGYLFPVRALIHILRDQSHALGRADFLTFRWGLTEAYSGNFTLVIGTQDFLADPTIEFRRDVKTQGEDPTNDCPPRRGCGDTN